MVIETNSSVQVAGMILLTNRLYADLMRTLQIYDEIFQRYSNISQLRCLELALRFVFFSIDENTAYPYFFLIIAVQLVITPFSFDIFAIHLVFTVTTESYGANQI